MNRKSKIIYGADADLLRAGFTLAPDAILLRLHELPVRPDPLFKSHRPRLNAKETDFLTRLIYWRFGLHTFNQPFPGLTALAKACGLSKQHATRVLKFLERQGLIQVKRSLRGLAHVFNIGPLLNKMRSLVGLKPKGEQAAPLSEPESASEPEPSRATRAAPEWEIIRQEALQKVSKGARHWFEGAQGYRAGSVFIVLAADRVKGRQLAHRYHDLIDSLIEKHCAWCTTVQYDAVKASA